MLAFESCSVHHGVAVWTRLRAQQPEALPEFLPEFLQQLLSSRAAKQCLMYTYEAMSIYTYVLTPAATNHTGAHHLRHIVISQDKHFWQCKSLYIRR